MCKWSDSIHNCCIHPDSPQDGDCDWADERCPYDEEDNQDSDDKLIDFLILTIRNSHKCQHCINCFNGCACINAYDCISHDFAEYDEGD